MRKLDAKRDRNKKVKDEIFLIAIKEMEKVGFQNLTIRGICAAANISTGMFYQHFETKEELLGYHFTRAHQEFEKKIAKKISNKKDVKTQLVDYYAWYTKYTAEFGLDFCQNFFNINNSTMNTDLFTNQVIGFTVDCITTAVEDGFILPDGGTIKDVADDLCVIVKGAIFNWCSHNGEFDLSKYVSRLLTRCMNGLM